MHHEVEIKGRARQVVVRRADAGFAVSIDGRTRLVDAARVDPQTLSLIVDGASFDVTMAPDRATGQVGVWVGGVLVTVAADGARRSRRLGKNVESVENAAGMGPQRLVAPMPGKIVRVAVKTGDAVRARQTLVVIEAMKMENELRASRAGTVGELHAREGMSVEAGALLVVIQ